MASSASAPRALITRSHPASASASAQPRPNPLEAAQTSARFPVIPVRALANAATRRFTDKQREVIARFETGELDQKQAQLEIEHFWAGALRRAVVDGDVETGSVMAGQSVGMVTREQPTAEIIAELVAGFDAATRRLDGFRDS